MRHIEFFDDYHFEHHYHRVIPPKPLSNFIDFFWQTKFENLWKDNPDGFSDYLFPNTGYSYLVNPGTPFTMQIGDDKYVIKNDSFLPRHRSIECHHQEGNVIFGTKFRISPVVFEKKINFSEYRKTMTPLSYLLDKSIVLALKEKISFQNRVKIMEEYFLPMLDKHEASESVQIVSSIMDKCIASDNYSVKIEDLSDEYGIASRTLQRYFEQYTSLGCKETLQILRARRIMEKITAGQSVVLKDSGFYDYSHFYKYMTNFLGKEMMPLLVKRMKENKEKKF